MRKSTASFAVMVTLAFCAACAGSGSDEHDAATRSEAGAGGSGSSGSGAGGTSSGATGGTGGAASAGTGGAASMMDAQVPDSGPTDAPDGGCSADCSGHGTCAANACTCEAGYVGAACDACAPGWSREMDDDACERTSGEPSLLTIAQWGTDGVDEVHSLCVGTDGEAIYAGDTDGTLEGETAAGNTDWVVGGRYPKAQSADDWALQRGSDKADVAHGIVSNEAGDLFVAGVTAGNLDGENEGFDDAVVSKWSADHTLEWTTQWGSEQGEFVADLARDDDGNLFVTGYTGGVLDTKNVGLWDVYLTKLSASGDITWTVQTGTAEDDRGIQVAVDGDGNAYVTGATGTGERLAADPALGGTDIFLLKVSSGGDVVWTRQWGSDADDLGLDVGVLDDGDLIVSGQAKGQVTDATGEGGAFVSRLDPDGEVRWTQQFGAVPQDGADRLVIANDTLYLAGSTHSNFVPGAARGGRDIFIQARDLDGEVLWSKQLGTDNTDQVSAIAAASDGTLFVGGSTAGSLPGFTLAGTWDNFLITVNP